MDRWRLASTLNVTSDALSRGRTCNLKPGTKYPPTLIATADHDDRVVPGHSFKFAATMQADQAGSAPILIRIETKAGHGAGKPISKIIDETADEWSFVAYNLKMDVKLQ